MKRIHIVIISFLFSLIACNDSFLDRFPETSIGKENFFNSEEDLKMYIYGLYNFPNITYGDDGYSTSDNSANTGNTEIKTMMVSDPSSSTITSGWDWTELRKINFFLDNYRKADLSPATLDHYEGLARFFRARFYMDKVKRYSDVPWYSKTLETNDPDLFKPRDPRTLVIDSIFADYEFARLHVNEDAEVGEVTKWVVMAYEARHALYEGTFRKYHNELGLTSSADKFLELARNLSKEIMDEGVFSIHNTGNPGSDYGSLFTSTDLTANREMIMITQNEHEVKNSGYWEFFFGDYEVGPSRDLLQAYLMTDGSYYSDLPGDIDTLQFVDEFMDRDPRLSQTFAYPGWELIGTGTYAQGAGIYVQRLQKNFTGYHQIKGFLNTVDIQVLNSVDFPVFRYAEILLIYAEARAELGELTQADLDLTINVLRDRAGMPHLTMAPAVDDWQLNKHPDISGSTAQWRELLEIRRERRIETALEGYRYDDLMRWKAGKLLEKEPEGLYFPGLGKYDLTGDGIEDIILIDISQSIPEADDKEKNSLGETLQYYRAGLQDSDAGVYLEEGNKGTVQSEKDRGTFQEPKFYYRPVPETDVLINPDLGPQLFGWE